MPYKSTADLPKAQTDQYSDKQKRAFMHAFNSAKAHGADEAKAFRIAHAAAKKKAK